MVFRHQVSLARVFHGSARHVLWMESANQCCRAIHWCHVLPKRAIEGEPKAAILKARSV